MEFEWDEAKDRSNQAKHQVSFETAATFFWADALIQRDDRADYGEERFIARGLSASGDGYHVVFTMRGPVVRIISMRRFSRKDYDRYGTQP